MKLNRLKTAFLVCIALPILSFGQTEWVKIIDENYTDIYFDSPSVGWAAGELGVVRKTTDGGETWKTVLSDYSCRMTKLEFAEGGGTGYGIYYGDRYICFATNGGKDWKRLTLDYDGHFTDVSLDYDAQTGYHTWIAAANTIFYCHNFSNNFTERKNGLAENHFPQKIKFIDDKNGWMFALTANNLSVIYYTNDGGLNWVQQSQFENIIDAMWFSTGGVGVVAGHNSDNTLYCYLTNDFGNTWDELQLPEMQNSRITDIIKEDGSPRIWISGEFYISDKAGALIYCETNWYDDWQIDSTFTHRSGVTNQLTKLNKLCLPTPSDGRNLFIAGNDLYYTKTANYEREWKSSQYNSTDYFINDIYFFDSHNGISVGSHLGIMKTADGGDNWEQINFDKNSTGELFKIFFLDDSTGWVCGSDGAVFKTEDAGTTWTLTITPTVTELHDIYFINENRGLAVGGSYFYVGTEYNDLQSILTTNDGGASWDVQEKQVYYDVLFDDELRAIFFISDTEGWIAGGSTVMHTTDAGNTWAETYSVLPNTTGCYNINTLYFSDENNGIAAGGGGPDQVWRTTDAGISWLDVTWDNRWSHGGYGITDMEFASPNFWAVSSTNIYKSNYYGSSWEWYETHGGFIGSSISMINENTGFISGGRTFFRRQIPILTSIDLKYEHDGGIPQEFSLSQNYPNPFNPSTQINYSLPESGNVRLIIYDILGREVAKIIDQFQSTGSYSIDFNAEELSSGIYFYRLIAGSFITTKKMILLK